jgi:hypothetical protein
MSYVNFSELENTNSTSVDSNYTKIFDFGNKINNQVNSPFNAANPLTYCLLPTMGTQFQHGSSTANLLSAPYSPNCEYFMAERCSVEWDGFCKAYQVLNVDTYWPNSGVVDGIAFSVAQEYMRNNKPTVGDTLVRNAVNLKLLEYPFLSYNSIPFDPNTANSPMVKVYPNYTSSPSILKKLATIDRDQHIALMLENPTACFDVLARIYLAMLRKETGHEQYKQTIVERYLKNNELQFQNFVKQAISLVPSYQLKPANSYTYSTCTKRKKNL